MQMRSAKEVKAAYRKDQLLPGGLGFDRFEIHVSRIWRSGVWGLSVRVYQVVPCFLESDPDVHMDGIPA